MKKFFDMLDSPTGGVRSISVAVVGFGWFALPIKEFMGVPELAKILSALCHKVDKCLSSGDTEDESIIHIASFMNSYSHIIHELPSVEEIQVAQLELLLASLFRVFPHLYPHQRAAHYAALSQLLRALHPKGSALKLLLSRVVLQGLLVTCSGTSEFVSKTFDAEPIPFYREYFPLWQHILRPPKREGDVVALTEEQYAQMCSTIFDEFIAGILAVIHKLNVSYTVAKYTESKSSEKQQQGEVAQGEASAATESPLLPRPAVQRDMDILLNLVEFCKLVLPVTNTHLFLRWVFLFARDILALSKQYPLLSGFYKLLTIVMRICEQHNFFKGVPVQDFAKEEMKLEEHENKALAFGMLKAGIKEVIVRLHQFQDELLASCLELVLSIPRELVVASEQLSPLTQALKMGVSYLPLANVGVEALEHWLQVAPNEFRPLLPVILPHLNGYLLVTSHADDAAQQAVAVAKKGGKAAEADPVVELQMKITRLLGKIGGDNAHILGVATSGGSGGAASATGIAWDMKKRLLFALPFGENSWSDLHLDSVIPRVVELARFSSDRQTKVAASELLHCIVLLMVGSHAFDPSTRKGGKSAFTQLYGHVFPALLALAIDTDPVTRQLYRNLVFQLIHYFTATPDNPDTFVCLSAIFDCIGEANGSLREFGAVCLSEFLLWSIKNTTKKSDNPLNVAALLKRLYSLAHHPSPYKRLGCAKAFNTFYRCLREEEPLISEFILEIAENFIFCLRLCNDDDASLGTADAVCSALQHVSRIVKAKAVLLNKPDDSRRGHRTLSSFVEELFKYTGRHETACRTVCRQLFMDFVTLLPDTPGAESWVSKNSSTIDFANILCIHTLTEYPQEGNLQMVNMWFERLTCAVEGYTWSNPLGVAPPTQSPLLPSLLHFIDRHALCAPPAEASLIAASADVDKNRALKCVMAISLFEYVCLLGEKGQLAATLGKLVGSKFCEFVFRCTLDCDMLGIKPRSAAETKRFYTMCDRVTRLLLRNLDAAGIHSLRRILTKLLLDTEYNLFTLPFDFTSKNIEKMSSLARGYAALHDVKLLDGALGVRSSAQLADHLARGVLAHCDTYDSPLKISLASTMLQLAFHIGMPPETVLSFLQDSEMVSVAKPSKAPGAASPAPVLERRRVASQQQTSSISQSASVPLASLSDSQLVNIVGGGGSRESTANAQMVSRGALFYKAFATLVQEQIVAHADIYAKALVGHLTDDIVFQLFVNCCQQCTRTRASLVCQVFIKEVVKYLPAVIDWSKPDSTLNYRLRSLELVKTLLAAGSQFVIDDQSGATFVKQAMANLLARYVPLSQKNEVLAVVPLLGYAGVDMVKQQLLDIVTYDFPLNSKELPASSVMQATYLDAVRHLLVILEQTRRISVLEVLFPVLRERDHVAAKEIEVRVKRFVDALSDDQAKAAFDACMEVFRGSSHPTDLKAVVVEQFAVPLVHKMSVSNQMDVFRRNIVHLLDVVAAGLPVALEEREKTIITKSAAFKILESMYDVLPAETVRSRVNSVFCDKPDAKGNELTAAVMRATHLVKTEKVADSLLSKPVLRDYHCSALRALAAVVICTQTKEDFFYVFFFKENPDKGELIWENIVPLDHKYTFEVETNFPVAKEAVQSLIGDSYAKTTTRSKDVRYISSEYLKDSSLSQDLSFFTFFANVNPAHAPAAGDVAPMQTDDFAADQLFDVALPENKLTNSKSAAVPKPSSSPIELDELNEHPCMPVMLKLVDHITTKFKYAPGEVPKWMTELNNKFCSPSTHENVKLFILKLIINRPSVFEHWANMWLHPIVEFVISPVCGTGFHYFLRDTCVLILRWLHFKKLTISHEDTAALSDFINHLFRCTPFPKRAVLRSNLDIIKLFVENCKGNIVPNKRIIVDFLTYANKNEKAQKLFRFVGLQILGVLVANGLPVYDPLYDTDAGSYFKFCEVLLSNLGYPSREVFPTAAEVCGLILQKRPVQPSAADSQFEDMLAKKILAMFNKSDFGQALQCLEKIGANYPVFLHQFFVRVFAAIPVLAGELKTLALTLVKWCAESIPQVFQKLESVKLDDLLRHRDTPTQFVTLKILYEILPSLTVTEIGSFFDTIIDVFPAHPVAECRQTYYDILCWCFEKHLSLRTSGRTRASLLRGIADTSPEIREKIFAFWDAHTPAEIVPRLTAIFSDLYTREIEDHWLSFCTNMLLNTTKLTHDYERTLFDKPLSECQFHDLKINPSWEYRSHSMTPMFSSQSQETNEGGDSSGGMIRATLENQLQFSLTQNMPMVSLDPSQSAQRTTLLFHFVPPTTGSFGSAATAVMPPPPVFGKAQFVASQEDRGPRVRRRFASTPATQAIILAQLKKKKQLENFQSKQAELRAAQVVMLRKYRTGELPDVQFRRKDVIITLQELSKRDSSVARKLFLSVFEGIFWSQPKEEKGKLIKPLHDCLQNLLQTTKYTSPFIGTLHDVDLIMIRESTEALLPPGLVGASAYRAPSLQTGVLLLEEMLILMRRRQQQLPKKEPSQEVTKFVDECWAQLGVLYKATHEEDILLGLYEKHFSRQPQTKEALMLELRGDYHGAIQIYDEVTKLLDQGGPWQETAPSPHETELWETGRLECMNKLLRWRNLLDNIVVELSDTEEAAAAQRVPLKGAHLNKLFSEQYMQLGYLHYYVLSTFNQHQWSDLSELHDSITNDNRVVLEELFAPELGYMFAARDDLEMARYYVLASYRSFIDRWSKLHPLALEARQANLQKLQKTVELEEFLQLVQNDKNFQSLKPLDNLLDRWRFRYPQVSLDDITVWDNVGNTRSLLLEKVHEGYAKYWQRPSAKEAGNEAVNVSALKPALLLERAAIFRKISDVARKKSNLAVAEVYLKLSMKSMPDKNEFVFGFFQSLVKLYVLKALHAHSAVERGDKLVKALKFVQSKQDEPLVQADIANRRKFYVMQGGLYHHMAELCVGPEAVAAQQVMHDVMKQFSAQAVWMSAYSCYSDAVELVQDSADSSLEGTRLMSKAFLRFSLFCSTLLKHMESGTLGIDPEATVSATKLADNVVANLLQAMRLQSKRAQDLFPRIMSMISKYPSAREVFRQHASSVPTWMYIPWISQLLAVLDSPEGPYVAQIIAELSRAYPQAMYYPLKISREQMGEQALRLCADIGAGASPKCELLDHFVESCHKLTHPEHRFKDWIDILRPLLPKKDKVMPRIRQTCKEIMDDLFTDQEFMGAYNRKFCSKYRSRVQQIFGKNCDALQRADAKTSTSKLVALVDEMRKGLQKVNLKLNDFTEWMSDFDHSTYFPEYLEVPGQYTGAQRPNPILHARVSSFSNDIICLSSLRVPKCLTLYGSDEREHKFLVKGGEDLRLDQRVEQLFTVMNDTYTNDVACYKRRLHLGTYKVVPMTRRVGIIEWVTNTSPLKEVLEEQWSNATGSPMKIGRESGDPAAVMYLHWIAEWGKRSTSKSGVAPYHAMFRHARREDVVKIVSSMHEQVPPDLLRRAILALATSPESYLAIRAEFARTLATFNISSYVVGIGDRHLENFLLRYKDGSLLGIDFGHAFGTATTFLPVPELMPFRLTRQLVEFLMPLDVDGMLKHNMLHVMTALRANRDVLLATMDVFVKEPLLNWDGLVSRIAAERGRPRDEEKARRWFPERRIALAAMKLDLVNPTAVTCAEIKDSTAIDNTNDEVCVIVKGNPLFNARARIGGRCASVQEQIDCLVDQATDPNILGRTWVGWSPWM
eukprot:TRINITY_DN1496_c0_g1_i7.p1 TRINITY_DN1496_c0_g1~~TRINITY_DN1496_c0_g1_i7.p1  ORF type:complete len:3703 (-),score=882.72 TRINITY_DN1496_c0_g1_i7:1157-12265(-)